MAIPVRARVLTPAIVVLAAAGILVVARGEGRTPATPAAAPAGDPAAAHAAAGVVAGPEVQAAFEARLRNLQAQVDAAPRDRARVLELARLLHDGHRTREAVPLYQRAIEIDPSEPGALFDLASAYGELGEWGRARDVLRARVEAAPADAVALYDLGVVEANLGDDAAAAELLRRALSVVGTDTELRARIEDVLSRLAPGAPRER